MKRTLLVLSLMLATVLVPAAAHADFFGAYLEGHGGYQQTNRTARPAIGAAAGIILFGFEAFADLRFLRDGMSEDAGMWNQLGLRFGLGLPVPVIDIEAFAGVSYVYSEVAEFDTDLADPEDGLQYKGFNPHLGVRIDVPIFAILSVGIQGETGYHYLFPNDQEYSAGMNYAVFGNLKLSI